MRNLMNKSKTWNPWQWTGCLVLPDQPSSLGLGTRPRCQQRVDNAAFETQISSGSGDMEIGMEVGFDGVATPRVQLNNPYPFSRNWRECCGTPPLNMRPHSPIIDCMSETFLNPQSNLQFILLDQLSYPVPNETGHEQIIRPFVDAHLQDGSAKGYLYPTQYRYYDSAGPDEIVCANRSSSRSLSLISSNVCNVQLFQYHEEFVYS